MRFAKKTLRDIDPALWVAVRVKATREGRSRRGLILWLLRQYVAGAVPPEVAP